MRGKHITLRQGILDATLMKNTPPAGAVAQLGERSVRNAEVEGSIPFRSTHKSSYCNNLRELSEYDF
jgi:hypothetical protein